MDIELARKDLDKSIEALSSAAQALRLTRFERLLYRTLMLSVDVATVTFATVMIAVLFVFSFTASSVQDRVFDLALEVLW